MCDFRLSYGRVLSRKSKIICVNRNEEQLTKVNAYGIVYGVSMQIGTVFENQMIHFQSAWSLISAVLTTGSTGALLYYKYIDVLNCNLALCNLTFWVSM